MDLGVADKVVIVTGATVIAGPGTVRGGTKSRWLPNQARSGAPSCPAG